MTDDYRNSGAWNATHKDGHPDLGRSAATTGGDVSTGAVTPEGPAEAAAQDPTVRPRIAHVCATKAGWLDGEGEAVSVDPAYVERVVRVFEAAGHGTPSIYPTEMGEVGLEWPDGREVIVACGPLGLGKHGGAG